MPLPLLVRASALSLLMALVLLSGAKLAAAEPSDEAAKARIEAADAASRAASEQAAKEAAELQAQADATQAQIEQLKGEIAKLQSELNSTTAQKQTLQGAIAALNLQIQKLQKQISLTNTQIKQKDAQINQLSGNITDTSGKINTAELGVSSTLRELETLDQEPLVITLLGGGSLSSFFDHAVTLGSLRSELGNKIQDLSSLKNNLQSSKDTAQTQRKQLASLKSSLAQQQQGLSIAKQSQNDLLKETQNKESNYQALIAEKQALERKFEQDLLNFEKQLGLHVDASTLPPSGAGELAWPLENVRITQFFGNTSFATQNPQIYNGHGHTGVDFAASPGTRVLAARGGVVLGTGNTDLTCPNASFGKWVFIKHDDGLSTLYAHLSVISVTQGEHVSQGEVVGYSGNTGYSTGPHLHFGVYASSGSEIATFPSSSCKGKGYTMPVGDISAYLNPLSYLPAR